MFFTFFILYKWYQIVQNITYVDFPFHPRSIQRQYFEHTFDSQNRFRFCKNTLQNIVLRNKWLLSNCRNEQKSWHFRRVLQKSYLKNHEKFLLKASCQSPIACRVRWNFIWEMPPPKTASLVFPELLGHVMAKTRPINKDTNKLFFQRNQQLICSLP